MVERLSDGTVLTEEVLAEMVRHCEDGLDMDDFVEVPNTERGLATPEELREPERRRPAAAR